MPSRVESPTLNFLAVAADEAFRARQHFLSGSPCESKEENSLGFDAAVNQVSDAIDERPSFSRASASDDEERTVPVCCSSRLLRIQISSEIPVGCGY
jgi:hypothetical protein